MRYGTGKQPVHIRREKEIVSKTCLVIRLGAYGDMVIITPVLKRLKELGYKVILNTSERGLEILKHSPYVDEFIKHTSDSVENEKLREHWKSLRDKVKPDKYINFSESLECNVAMHPLDPLYIYPKYERHKQCNRNYYDVTEEWAEISGCQKTPILHFTEDEEREAQKLIKKGKFTILWSLSGSGRQKVYPWSDYVIGEVLKNYKDIHFLTVGDERCKLLESLDDKDITNLSGEISIRTAMCLTKFVNLVIAPDTGVLHASGCYETPKIGLLGHTTRTNITKYFKNDYSIEAECDCSPCYRLIYDFTIQCPIEPLTHAAWCMAEGIPPEKIYGAIEYIKSRR